MCKCASLRECVCAGVCVRSMFIGLPTREHLETETETKTESETSFSLHSEVAHFAIIIPLCIENETKVSYHLSLCLVANSIPVSFSVPMCVSVCNVKLSGAKQTERNPWSCCLLHLLQGRHERCVKFYDKTSLLSVRFD